MNVNPPEALNDKQLINKNLTAYYPSGNQFSGFLQTSRLNRISTHLFSSRLQCPSSIDLGTQHHLEMFAVLCALFAVGHQEVRGAWGQCFEVADYALVDYGFGEAEREEEEGGGGFHGGV